MNSQFPPISVVIIGLNVEKHIKECISSVLDAEYPGGLIDIIYVDGGSNDLSVNIAKSFERVRVVELNDPHPTPGRGRNAGYRAASHELIQFMDADTVLVPGWFKTALPYLKDKNAAVKGKVIEKYPRKNNYHLIGDIEWNISAGKGGLKFSDGPSKTFGGIVLIRKDVLDKVNGYDEMLVAGEDPDISYRVRQAGWSIYQINADMVVHDLNMNTFRQYLKRAYRSGHAYAEIGLRYCTRKEKYFLRQLLRILLGATLPLIVLIVFLLSDLGLIGLMLAVLFAARPLIKVMLLKKSFNLSTSQLILYGSHLSFVLYPQFFGVMRYMLTLVSGMPLQNKGYVRQK